MITSIDQLDANQRYSYADYLAWQFTERLELLKGHIRQMAAPNRKHQGISSNLLGGFYNYFKNKECRVYHAPFDVRLVKNAQGTTDKEIYSVVQPDICVICDLSKLDDRGCLGAPEFIIEIVSPSNSKTDVQDKFELYRENGVLEYWIVYPEPANIYQFVLENEKYELKKIHAQGDFISPSIFPDLSVDLNEVFENL